MQNVIGERLSGAVGEYAAPVTPKRGRQRKSCRFQVALQAHLHLPFRAQPRWIHDTGTRESAVSTPDSLHVTLSRAVATLAVYAFGEFLEHRLARIYFAAGITVVAEHALNGDPPAKVPMVGAIVAGTHCPISAVFGIPTHRKLYEDAIGS